MCANRKPFADSSHNAPSLRDSGRWRGDTVCIIASGPSLTVEDCEFAGTRPWRFIAINDSYKRAKFADILYACDGGWWKVYYKEARQAFQGELWTQDEWAASKYGLNRIGSESHPGLGRKDVIHQGGNSGYQAINLAYLLGADRIILLGFDCGPSKKGEAHWFGQHPPSLTTTQPYDLWQAKFPRLADDLRQEGVEVINASRETHLTCFERKTIDQC